MTEFFSINYPELKGFNCRGLYRMKQFYELYSDDKKVSTLLTQLSWSNHLKIMSGSKSKEEREFYINLAIKENLTHRELVRQIDIGYYECYMLSNFVLEKKEIKMRINDFHKTLELITRGWAVSLKNRRKHVPILTEIKIRTCFLINSVKSREINHP